MVVDVSFYNITIVFVSPFFVCGTSVFSLLNHLFLFVFLLYLIYSAVLSTHLLSSPFFPLSSHLVNAPRFFSTIFHSIHSSPPLSSLLSFLFSLFHLICPPHVFHPSFLSSPLLYFQSCYSSSSRPFLPLLHLSPRLKLFLQT